MNKTFLDFIEEQNKKLSYDLLFIYFIVFKKLEYIYNSKNIAFIGLCNKAYGKPKYVTYLELISKFINYDSIYIFDEPEVISLLRIYLRSNGINIKKIKFVEIKHWDNIKSYMYNINMKFDCIVMNPPYSRNLHLKILAEAIKHLKDEKSKCISLQPIDKFQIAIKHEKKLPVKLSNIEKISQTVMCKLFNIGLWVDGGICINDKKATDDWNKFTYIVDNFQLYKKIKSKISVFLHDKFVNIPKKYSLRFFVGCNCDNSHNYSITPKKYDEACKIEKNGHIKFINCNTEKERINLYSSCNTIFMKFCTMLDLNIRPFMEDYSQPWTDERFYKFFDLTENEIKIIEETMAKYK